MTNTLTFNADQTAQLIEASKRIYKNPQNFARDSRNMSKIILDAVGTRPEDVPAGEAWRIKVDEDYETNAIKNNDTNGGEWTVQTEDDYEANHVENYQVTLIAKLVPETEQKKNEHRIIDNEDDLKALPGNTIVMETRGMGVKSVFRRSILNLDIFSKSGSGSGYSAREVLERGPVKVIYTPEDE